LALPVDSLAHREVTDSSSVWEAPTSRLRAVARTQRFSLRQALQKLHGVRPQALLRAASKQQELAVTPGELVDAPAAWLRLDLAQEKSLRAPRVERSLALE
jgi:hypothetical protein